MATTFQDLLACERFTYAGRDFCLQRHPGATHSGSVYSTLYAIDRTTGEETTVGRVYREDGAEYSAMVEERIFWRRVYPTPDAAEAAVFLELVDDS